MQKHHTIDTIVDFNSITQLHNSKTLHCVPAEKEKPRLTIHYIERPSGKTSNHWTRHGMTSVSRQWTEMSEKNGLPDVLLTGRTKIR